MHRTRRQRRLRRALVGIAVAMTLAAAPSAAAGAFFGNATIRPAAHSSGRTLSGQGVEMIAAGAHAGTTGGVIVLPIDFLAARSASPAAKSSATLSFVHGQDSLTLSEIRFDFRRGTLEGTIGGRRLAAFRLGTAVDIDPVAGSVLFVDGRLRLTDAMAELLRNGLGLERALMNSGVGEVSMGATETTSSTCVPVVVTGPQTRPPPPPEDCVGSPNPEAPPPPIVTP